MKIIWSSHFTDDIKYYFKKKHYKKIFDDLEPVLSEPENDKQISMMIKNVIEE